MAQKATNKVFTDYGETFGVEDVITTVFVSYIFILIMHFTSILSFINYKLFYHKNES